MADLTPASVQEIRDQLGTRYAQFSEDVCQQHVELLQQVRVHKDVFVRAEEFGGGHWVVTVAAADHLGLLSVISGLFTSHGLNLMSGDVFTLRVAHKL